jgi:pantoate--beta-alanine ligase
LVKAREVASAQILSDNGNSLGITPAMLSAMVADEINSNPLLETEYAEIVNSLTLQIVTDWADAEELQLCVAVNASPVRLIDNIKLK